MTYVYILSDYEEDGAENVVATLNKTKLASLLIANWPTNEKWEPHRQERHNTYVNTALDALVDLAHKLDNEGKHQLSNGWGGIQLHVTELK